MLEPERSLALSTLLRAHRLGYHVIVAPRETARWIEQNVELAPIDASIIRAIGHQFTQTGNLLTEAKRFLEVVATSEERTSNYERSEIVPLSYFARKRLADPTVLLVEDSATDGEVYKILLDCLKTNHQCRHPHLEVMHGGGERIGSVLKGQIDNTRLIACVIDSDRPAPFTDKPTKLQRLERIVEESHYPFAFLYCTPVREAENFLPLHILSELKNDFEPRNVEYLLQIAEMEEPANELDRFWFYFDIKQGVCLNDLQKIKNPGWRAWMEERLKLAFEDLDEANISGFGESIMSQILRSNRSIDTLRQSARTNEWRGCFWSFFDDLLWLSFGAHPQFT